METVYVLTVIWQRDSGECGDTVAVFQNIDSAQAKMEQEMKDARTDFSDLDTEETEYSDGDMGWSIWETGEYCYNHCDITIREMEVQ